MRIDIIIVSPELIKSPFGHSIIKWSIDKKLIEVHFNDLKKDIFENDRMIKAACFL